ncbi:MAG: GNAT family N-acetyltransferase [Phycisphaerales bacterium]|nr:MAG: GNAT family N-acetyltransferase [Phycisphaerales bacterium]
MVRTTYLEITSKAQWIRRSRPETGLDIRECLVKQPQFNRFLYEYIGRDWKWTFRLSWSPERWNAYASAENLRTFVAYQGGSIAGYYELRRDEDGVEIRILGLAPGFIGRGHGGPLLDHAIETAFGWGASRVWLHTCTDDHQNALNNYCKSGFAIFKVENETADESSASAG